MLDPRLVSIQKTKQPKWDFVNCSKFNVVTHNKRIFYTGNLFQSFFLPPTSKR